MISVQRLNLSLQESLRLLLLMCLSPERFLKLHNFLKHNAVRALILNQWLPVKSVHIRFYHVQLPLVLLQSFPSIFQFVIKIDHLSSHWTSRWWWYYFNSLLFTKWCYYICLFFFTQWSYNISLLFSRGSFRIFFYYINLFLVLRYVSFSESEGTSSEGVHFTNCSACGSIH